VTYTLDFAASGRKDFLSLPPEVRAQLLPRLEALRENPRPRGAEALAGRLKGLHRLRVGDYRVVFQVDERAREVTVTRVRHRSQVYK
jgi:mRNA interferase RelE/StbE